MSGDGFADRRKALRDRLDKLDVGARDRVPERTAFFERVYETAGGDTAFVPWADLKPKDRLQAFLADHPGNGRRAIDVACGLGDNAEALGAAGWRTTAFDVSGRAVAWARERFPATKVEYRVADLTALPPEWAGGFDLVHECYTIQSVSGELRRAFARAIASLVAPGGRLLVYARFAPDGNNQAGPPWPLTPDEAAMFADFGLVEVSEERFDLRRPDRVIPHLFAVWERR